MISNASLFRRNGQPGAWRLVDGDLAWTAVRLGASDLDGKVQVLEGLTAGDQVVLHSAGALPPAGKVKVVESLAGRTP